MLYINNHSYPPSSDIFDTQPNIHLLRMINGNLMAYTNRFAVILIQDGNRVQIAMPSSFGEIANPSNSFITLARFKKSHAYYPLKKYAGLDTINSEAQLFDTLLALDQ